MEYIFELKWKKHIDVNKKYRIFSGGGLYDDKDMGKLGNWTELDDGFNEYINEFNLIDVVKLLIKVNTWIIERLVDGIASLKAK